jgi:hypothetical protein
MPRPDTLQVNSPTFQLLADPRDDFLADRRAPTEIWRLSCGGSVDALFVFISKATDRDLRNTKRQRRWLAGNSTSGGGGAGRSVASRSRAFTPGHWHRLYQASEKLTRGEQRLQRRGSGAGRSPQAPRLARPSGKGLDPTARPRSGLGKIVGTICFLQEARDEEISCERVLFFPWYLGFIYRSRELARALAKPKLDPMARIERPIRPCRGRVRRLRRRPRARRAC